MNDQDVKLLVAAIFGYDGDIKHLICNINQMIDAVNTKKAQLKKLEDERQTKLGELLSLLQDTKRDKKKG